MAIKQKKQEKASAPSGKAPNAAGVAVADESPSKIRAFGQYFEDAKTELGKVSWPTKKEVRITSVAVLILVVVMSFFLGIVDVLLTKIVESLLSMGL